MLQQILAIWGLFLSFLFIYYNIKKKQGAIYIGMYFFFFSAYNFFQFTILYSESVKLISYVFIHTAFIGYLIGPMLFFYVRNRLSGSNHLRKKDLIHYVPVVLFIVAASKYYLMPQHMKVEIAEKLVENKFNMLVFSSEYLGWLIPNQINYVGRSFLLFVYSVWSLIMLFKFTSSKSSAENLSVSQTNFRWLYLLLIFTILLSFFQTILILQSAKNGTIDAFYTFNIFQVLSGIALVAVITIPFFYPSVLYGLDQNDSSGILDETMNLLYAESEDENIVYKKQHILRNTDLDTEYIRFIDSAIINCMENDKPYLQRDCNLSYFSKVVHIPQHHLSYYFREVKKQSFTDYRNEWRVKHARVLIEEKMNKVYTLETIGKMSGFASKNAFFVSFKKLEGTTPGNFGSPEN